MNIQYIDDLSNFLRVSFLLFHSLVFYYIFFWRTRIEPHTDRNAVKYFFIVTFLHFTLNFIILFKAYIGENYLYLIYVNTVLLGAIIFYGYKSILNYKLYYLLLIPVFSVLLLFRKDVLLTFLALFLVGISYFHIWYKEKVSLVKPSKILPSLIRRGVNLSFVFFGLYVIFLSFYLVTESLIFNISATILVLISLSSRVKSAYEEKFQGYLFYISVFIVSFLVSFLVLFYFSNKYINDIKDMDIYHKKLNLERISLEIKNKIDFYSKFIKIISSSEDLKNNIKKDKEELDKYLSSLNQSLDTALIFFVDKTGKVIACSAEYRKIMINRDVSFRKYFKEAIKGNLSVFIARGVYTGRDDIRIAYPVYDKEGVIGILVFQFYISEDIKKHIKMENAIVMHSSGGILIGKDELRNRLIFNPPEEELKKVYEEKIFGNDTLLPSGFKQIDNDVFEDYNGKKWQIIKHEFIKDWSLAGLLNLSKYDGYKAISFIFLLILTLISNSFAIKNFERLRTVFLNLAEEPEEKRIAFDSIDSGIIYTDAKGKIKYMNKEAMKILQVSEESLGRDLKEILSLKEHDNPEYKILKIGEEQIPVIYTENPILIKDFKFGAIITIKDATEIIKKEEIEKRIERVEVISKISAGIVHDLNNYLMVLMGNLSLLNEIEKDEKHRKLIQNILEATKLMRNTIEELRDLSPDFVSKKEPVNLVEIAKKSLEFLLNGTKIVYELDVEKPLSNIYADRGQVYRIFQNIIVNAKQAMGQEGKIIVTMKNIFNNGEIPGLSKGKFIFVSISDTGGGIPDEYIDKIFDPFFTMKKEGKGLGLSIVRSIIEKMDGKIEVESKIGIGTTFKIYLSALE